MHLIADSGSTKTTWRIVNNPQFNQATNGLNPMVAPEEFIIRELKNLSEIPSIQEKITQISFYGAGCSKSEGASIMHSYLQSVFKNTEISVESDLKLAALALFGDQSGVVCILGTGSNAAYFDGKELTHHVPSLGYVLADDGGGVGLGKSILKSYLYGNEHWRKLFEQEQLETDKNKIIHAIYNMDRPNTYMAKYAQAALHHLDLPVSRQLVKAQFEVFFKDMVVPNLQTSKNIGFVGSVSYLGRTILEELCQEHGLQLKSIIQYPINGLMDYLENKH